MKPAFLLLCLILLSEALQAQTRFTPSIKNRSFKAIYGEDNRRKFSDLDAEVEKDKKLIDLSRSLLAQVPHWRVTEDNKEEIQVKTYELKKGLNLCESERFTEEPYVSVCSAFLVAPDLILTAGHCIKNKYDCKKNYWVLDYDHNQNFKYEGTMSFAREKVFSCEELVSWSNNTKLDYALVRLDREISDREPLKIKKSGNVEEKDELALIGHPLGLPKIVADNIFVIDNTPTYVFKTNADSFSGNSGSPMISLKTGLVEGMLVRGEADFELDLDLNCQRSTVCSGYGCRGESVLRSSFFPIKHIPKTK